MYATKKKYYEMKEGLEVEYKQVEDQLVELRSKVFRPRVVKTRFGRYA